MKDYYNSSFFIIENLKNKHQKEEEYIKIATKNEDNYKTAKFVKFKSKQSKTKTEDELKNIENNLKIMLNGFLEIEKNKIKTNEEIIATDKKIFEKIEQKIVINNTPLSSENEKKNSSNKYFNNFFAKDETLKRIYEKSLKNRNQIINQKTNDFDPISNERNRYLSPLSLLNRDIKNKKTAPLLNISDYRFTSY